MKTFNTPYVEVIKFHVSDVITASNDETDDEQPGGLIGDCAG